MEQQTRTGQLPGAQQVRQGSEVLLCVGAMLAALGMATSTIQPMWEQGGTGILAMLTTLLSAAALVVLTWQRPRAMGAAAASLLLLGIGTLVAIESIYQLLSPEALHRRDVMHAPGLRLLVIGSLLLGAVVAMTVTAARRAEGWDLYRPGRLLAAVPLALLPAAFMLGTGWIPGMLPFHGALSWWETAVLIGAATATIALAALSPVAVPVAIGALIIGSAVLDMNPAAAGLDEGQLPVFIAQMSVVILAAGSSLLPPRPRRS